MADLHRERELKKRAWKKATGSKKKKLFKELGDLNKQILRSEKKVTANPEAKRYDDKQRHDIDNVLLDIEEEMGIKGLISGRKGTGHRTGSINHREFGARDFDLSHLSESDQDNVLRRLREVSKEKGYRIIDERDATSGIASKRKAGIGKGIGHIDAKVTDRFDEGAYDKAGTVREELPKGKKRGGSRYPDITNKYENYALDPAGGGGGGGAKGKIPAFQPPKQFTDAGPGYSSTGLTDSWRSTPADEDMFGGDEDLPGPPTEESIQDQIDRALAEKEKEFEEKLKKLQQGGFDPGQSQEQQIVNPNYPSDGRTNADFKSDPHVGATGPGGMTVEGVEEGSPDTATTPKFQKLAEDEAAYRAKDQPLYDKNYAGYTNPPQPGGFDTGISQEQQIVNPTKPGGFDTGISREQQIMNPTKPGGFDTGISREQQIVNPTKPGGFDVGQSAEQQIVNPTKPGGFDTGISREQQIMNPTREVDDLSQVETIEDIEDQEALNNFNKASQKSLVKRGGFDPGQSAEQQIMNPNYPSDGRTNADFKPDPHVDIYGPGGMTVKDVEEGSPDTATTPKFAKLAEDEAAYDEVYGDPEAISGESQIVAGQRQDVDGTVQDTEDAGISYVNNSDYIKNREEELYDGKSGSGPVSSLSVEDQIAFWEKAHILEKRRDFQTLISQKLAILRGEGDKIATIPSSTGFKETQNLPMYADEHKDYLASTGTAADMYEGEFEENLATDPEVLRKQKIADQIAIDDKKQEEHDRQKKEAEFEDLAREQELDIVNAKEEYKNEVTKYKEYIHKLTNTKLDPDRYWNNASTGKKISMFLGAIVASGSGVKGSNPVWDDVDASIKRDIEAQKEDLVNFRAGASLQSNLVEKLYRQYGDVSKAVEGADFLYQKAVIEVLQKKLAMASDPLQKQRIGKEIKFRTAAFHKAKAASDLAYRKVLSKRLGEERSERSSFRSAYQTKIKDLKIEDISYAYNLAKTAFNSKSEGVQDLALITAMARLNDPGSTVRSAEFKTWSNASGAVLQAIIDAKGIFTGQKLSAEIREAFMNYFIEVGKRTGKRLKKINDDTKNEISNFNRQYGYNINPDFIQDISFNEPAEFKMGNYLKRINPTLFPADLTATEAFKKYVQLKDRSLYIDRRKK